MLRPVDIDGQKYFVFAELTEEAWTLRLTDTRHVWHLRLNRSAIDVHVESSGLSCSNFERLFRCCFCVETKAAEDVEVFELKSEQSDSKLRLEWRQVVDGGTKYLIGEFELTEVDDGLTELFSYLCERTNHIQAENSQLLRENKRLAGKYEVCVEDLRRCKELTGAVEGELLSKFVILLNNKKAKIRQLKKSLALPTTTTSATASVEQAAVKVETKRKAESLGEKGEKPMVKRRKKLPVKIVKVEAASSPGGERKKISNFEVCSSDSTVDLNQEDLLGEL